MKWELEFSMIDAKDYPVIIAVKDGDWEACHDLDDREERIIEQATRYYLSKICQLQEDVRKKFIPFMTEDGMDGVPEPDDCSDFWELYYT